MFPVRPFLYVLTFYYLPGPVTIVTQPIYHKFTEKNNKLMTHTYTKNLLIVEIPNFQD